MNASSLDQPPSLLVNLITFFRLLTRRERRMIGWMFGLQIISAASEILSLGAVLPFLSALTSASQLLSKPILQPWFNLLSIHSQEELVVAMATLFAGAILLSNALRLLTIRMQYFVSAQIGNSVSAEVYRRILYQPFSFHSQHSSSEIISLITTDTSSVSGGLIPSFFYLATNTLVVIAIIATIMVLDFWIALGTTIIIGGSYRLIIVKTRSTLHANSRKISELNSQCVKTIQEGLGGIRDVLIDGSQGVFESAYRQSNRALLKAQGANNFIAMSPRFLVEPIAMCAIAALAVIMANDSAQLQRVLPLLGALALGANRLLPAIQQCYVSLSNIRGSQTALIKVNQALCHPINPQLVVTVNQKIKFENELRFEDVWFSYPTASSDWVLTGVNLTIKPKTIVAFIGATGCGKSTMADLILGLLEPKLGQISVDGKTLTSQQMRSWQSSVAHVPQQIYLSDASIAENIAFGVPREEIDMARVHEAAELALISDFVEKRPLKYQEIVGERGIRLSGGQRQRIGIARALYKRASIIVFDEATSALDNTTEREIMGAIESLSNRLTIILIAHRLSTIRNADLVYELKDGKVHQA